MYLIATITSTILERTWLQILSASGHLLLPSGGGGKGRKEEGKRYYKTDVGEKGYVSLLNFQEKKQIQGLLDTRFLEGSKSILTLTQNSKRKGNFT